MKRYAKQLIAELQRLGFDEIWTNSSGFPCYAHPNDPAQQELSINPSATEQAARSVLRRAQRIAGTTPTVDKRRASQVKARAEADRERARTRLAWIQAKQQRLINEHAAPDRIAQANALIAQREDELAAIEGLMVQPPAGGSSHRGTAQPRHRTGARP